MIHICGPTSQSKLGTFEQDQVQPNAVDIKIEKIFKIKNTPFIISEDEKTHRETEEVLPEEEGKTGQFWWNLEPGTYEIKFHGNVFIADNEAGMVIVRSSFNRNGIYLTTGLYDSGYKGVMAGCLHVTAGPAKIKKGTRIGQFLLFHAECLNLYDGDYGLGKEHDKKYEDGTQ